MEMMMRQQRIWQSSKYRLHEIQMTLSEYCDFQCSIPYRACVRGGAQACCCNLMRMSI